jgi:uncharacterized protein YbcI
VFDFNLADQKNAIAYEAGIFLKQEFGFPSASVSVMMEKAMVLIRAENFLCLAEQKLGSRKNADSLHQMYAKIFDAVKKSFVERINQIISRKIVSSQIGINSSKTPGCSYRFFGEMHRQNLDL